MWDTIYKNKVFDIIHGMTQEEIIQQCLHVIKYPNKNINFYELQYMYNKIKFERNEWGVIDRSSNTWVRTQPIKDKLRELEHYYL